MVPLSSSYSTPTDPVIRWLHHVTNSEVYTRAGLPTSVSTIIRRPRLRFLGHIARSPSETDLHSFIQLATYQLEAPLWSSESSPQTSRSVSSGRPPGAITERLQRAGRHDHRVVKRLQVQVSSTLKLIFIVRSIAVCVQYAQCTQCCLNWFQIYKHVLS